MTSPRARAREAVSEAVRRRDEARQEYDTADADLRQSVRDAESVGVSIAELARMTGWHRNTVTAIVGKRED